VTALLEARDLKLGRGGKTIIEVDYLSVERGEVLAVIGPNGSGKSTLLLALGRLLKPLSGQVLFNGKPADSYPELEYRRRIALVMQDPLLLDASVFDNVAAGLRFRGIPRQEVRRRADEWLERLGIGHLRRRKALTLSGGEAQRASLARALALDPEILLLDEPFGALDAPTRSRLLDDLQTVLTDSQVTTIFITHDLDEALLLGNRVAVLLGGRMRQFGRPEQVFTAPADREVAEFVGVETVIAGEVASSDMGQVIVHAHNLTLEAVGEAEKGREVFFCLRPEDITLYPGSSSPSSSARNRLPGRIRRITPQGPLVRVVVDCGFLLTALITRTSAAEMELTENKEVTAAFKASAVHLIPH
jgi:tungstate transport system ATP-binding protein